MRQTRLIMGMPVVVEIVDGDQKILDRVFDWFEQVDNRFSTYKPDSEISQLNNGLSPDSWSKEMRQILELAATTRRQTDGYFNVQHGDLIDPSGIVKGWAIQRAAELVLSNSYTDFYIEAGGDIQVGGRNTDGQPWKIGIRNPANRKEIIKVLTLSDAGVATSGTAARGQHIYDPHDPKKVITDILSLTVVAPSILDADRFATAAFAMGGQGISFIESQPGLEGYMIDKELTATYTSNFERYLA